MTDELTLGGHFNRMVLDAEVLMDRLDELNCSTETKRAIVSACSEVRKSKHLYDLDRREP